MISVAFYNISGLGACGLSFFEGFALRYVISDLSLIAYQKLPPLLEMASTFDNLQ